MIPEIVIYLLKVNLSILLFYFSYRLFLKRFTFYSQNRFFLLLGLIYSVLYPLINLADLFKSNPVIKEQIISISPDWQYSAAYIDSGTEVTQSIYWQIVIIIFWTGVSLMIARLIIQLISLLILHLKSEPAISGNYNFRIVRKKVNPFSFWNTIYINPEYHEPKELESILEHEQVHVNQLHSLDVLLAEICTAFFWFNPGVWLIKDAIQANLEFITDLKVLNSGIDSKEYQYALLKINVLPQNTLPVNNFHLLTIKRRIAMMNKKQSNRINKGIYILLLPAIMCMVLILTNPKAALSNCQLGGVMVNLNEMPEIIGLKSDLIPQSTKPSNVALLQNKQNQTNNPTATVLPDTTKLKKAVIKFTAIADTIKTGEKKPLYIVDGIEFTGISNLNPENIASITVLKGASAMAKYGNTGSEGVIEITSKAAASNSQGNTIPPVSSNTIILRKAESEKSSFEGLSSNELIILNGKEADRSVLNDLKVMSVAKIVVFKGQKALSKFGEKGRNGVIQITTKPNK